MSIQVKTQTFQNVTSSTYTLTNKIETKLVISDIGATITHLILKNKAGQDVDLVLGYDQIESYLNNTNTYFGATVGRHANRIANAQFTLNETTYRLVANDGPNNTHSAPNGYQTRIWKLKNRDDDNNIITLSLDSEHLDQGYPGHLRLEVSFQLSDANEVIITYVGLSDKDTIFNPTNHSYFNLNGHQAGTTLKHQMHLNASHFTPIKDRQGIPTGELRATLGTPFDFSQAKSIGQDIHLDDEQLTFGTGYDHNFVNDNPGFDVPFATVEGDLSGITLRAFSDLPGFHFYSGNFLGDEVGKDQTVYHSRDGFCLETQYFPNAINEPSFEQPILLANQPKESRTVYAFSLGD